MGLPNMKRLMLAGMFLFFISYPMKASAHHLGYVCSTFAGIKALSKQKIQNVRLPRTFRLGGGVCHFVPLGTVVEQVSGGDFPCIQSNEWSGCRYIQRRVLRSSDIKVYKLVPGERRKYRKVGKIFPE